MDLDMQVPCDFKRAINYLIICKHLLVSSEEREDYEC